jgi:hypothetical protein
MREKNWLHYGNRIDCIMTAAVFESAGMGRKHRNIYASGETPNKCKCSHSSIQT